MTLLWTTAVLAPLLTVLALALVGLQPSDPSGDRARDRIAWIAPWTTLPALGLALAGPAAGRVELPGLLLGTTLEVDGLARPLLLAVVVIYLTALWSAAARRTHRSPLLTGVLLLCFLGNAGALVAADAVTFYLSFAVMSFAAYGLIVHRGTDRARHAARVYLVLTVLSEVLVLLGLMFVVTAGGRLLADVPAAVAGSDHTTTIVVLLLLGFGIKAGTVPLHIWVAPAYRQAPAPGAAVLSGALSKVGLVGMVRFLPLGEVAMPTVGWLLVWAGLVGMFGAVLGGVLRDDGRTALAYSSVSQLGLLALLVGAALVEPAVAPACVVALVGYVLHHGLAKAALFLGAPLWAARGRLRGWVAVGSGIAALAIAGAPLTTGFLAKYAAKEAVYDLPGLATALTVLGVGSTLILARALWLLHRLPEAPVTDIPVEDAPGPAARAAGRGARETEPATSGESPHEDAGEAHPPHTSRAAVTAWSLLAVAAAGLPWVVVPAWLPQADRPDVSAANLWEAAWPVLGGLVLSAAAWCLARWGTRPFHDPPVLPAGDLLVPVEATTRAAVRGTSAMTSLVTRAYRTVRDGALTAADRTSPAAAAESGESRLGPWRASGLALLAVAAGILLVGWW